MTDTDNASATAKRAKASERLMFDATGAETSNPLECAKAGYKIPATGHTLEYVFGDNPAVDRAFAVFGFHTKIGNVANTVRNDKSDPGTPDDEAEAIDDFFASLANGQWREPSEGGPRGPKYDDAILGDVIAKALGDKAKGDGAHYAARLADKAYRQKILAAQINGQTVKDLYAAEAAARGIAKPAAPVRDLGDLA